MAPSVAQTAKVATTSASTSEIKPLSRREFLNYLLGGSLALLGVESCAAAAWFALPRIQYGVENGLFLLDPKVIPPNESAPVGIIEGKFWLSNTPQGLLALDMHCVFVRQAAYYKWVPSNNRFECPACGSKFRANGEKIDGLGPAPRDLDRFAIEVTTPTRKRRTSPIGDPVDVTDATSIVIATNHKILGKTLASTTDGYTVLWDDSCQCSVLVPKSSSR